MMQAPDLPLWASIIVAFLIFSGAAMTLIGSIGLLWLRTFYERVHAPTLGTSFGTLLICLASIVCFSVLRSRPSVHEILIVVFITLTAPVSFMLLGRAALYRDRIEGHPEVPPQPQ